MRSAKPRERARKATSLVMSLMLVMQLLGVYAPAAFAETLEGPLVIVEAQGEDGGSTAEELVGGDAAHGEAADGESVGESQSNAVDAQEANNNDVAGSADAIGNPAGNDAADGATDDVVADKDDAIGDDKGSKSRKVSLAKGLAATPRGGPSTQEQNYAVHHGETLTFYWGVPPAESDDKVFLGGASGDYPRGSDGRPFDAVAQYTSMVVFDASLIAEDGTSHLQPTSTADWFVWFSAWGYERLDRIDMSHVTSMKDMFSGAESVGALSNIENWDVSNVEDMSGAFCLCNAVSFDLSAWDVSNVKNFGLMFDGSGVESIDLSGWDTTQATNLDGMFNDCKKLKKVTLGKKFSFNGQDVLDDAPTKNGYDGKWVYTKKADGVGDEVRVGTAMTAAELRDSYNGNTMAGTWEWNKPYYTVHFDSNGGAGEMGDQEFKPGEEKKLAANGFAYEGSAFMGWNTKADGTGDSYNDEAKVCDLTELNHDTVTLYAQWARVTPVPYISDEEVSQLCEDYAVITEDSCAEPLASGWYVAYGNVSLPERLQISGEVSLILRDGATLTATKGVNLAPGNTLNVYGQKSGTGTLTATAPEGCAGIGGNLQQAGGDLGVYGGVVVAQAGAGAEAIGRGASGAGSGGVALYRTARVLHGASADSPTTSASSERVDGCRDSWVRIEPCKHDDIAYELTANKAHHTKACPHCHEGREADGSAIEYEHEFTEKDGGWECVCGQRAYKVAFNKNADDATGSMEESDLIYEGDSYKIPACAFEREGHTLVGWNTKADGSGTDYANEDTITSVEASLTLHAQWKVTEYTVTFDPTSGTMDEAQRSQLVEHGGKATRPTSPVNEGQVFAGWYSDQGLTQKYDFSKPVTSNLMLRAKWRGRGPVDYVDEGGETQTRGEGDYTLLTEAMDGQAITAGWYAVLGDVVLAERLEMSGEVHLILRDDATLTASKGINLTPGNELWVYGQEDGSGKLVATSVQKYYSGIGGGPGESAGDIVMCGGNVIATAFDFAAGIGGGGAWADSSNKRDVNGGKVTVYDGIIEATAGRCGAAIGGGYGDYNNHSPRVSSNSGEITITGGTVKAYSPTNAAAIGGGEGGNSASISISGDAKVEATAGYGGAAIGGGLYGTNADIRISGSCEVTATQNGGGAGIGSGKNYPYSRLPSGAEGYLDMDAGSIYITGGKVQAFGGEDGAGIGGGDHAGLTSVLICDSAEVEAYGGLSGPGIGSGHQAKRCGTITIEGGTVTAKGNTRGLNATGQGGAGIGLAYDSPAESGPIVNISGGKVTAEGKNSGAGIGGSYRGNGGNITISGDALVEAIGGEYASGIGGGYRGENGGSLTVTGGTVIARGGKYGAGIGGGYVGSGATVKISAGSVKAIGGENGSGIGSGYTYNDEIAGGQVTISGGTVVAQGGKYGAGIGSGNVSDTLGGGKNHACEVTISGDAKVAATGGYKAAGIGGGSISAGGKLVVNASADVTAQAGWGTPANVEAQAIGHGADNTDEGTIELYNEAGVQFREAKDSARQEAVYDERVDKCRLFWARITTSPLEFALTLDANDDSEEPETSEEARVRPGESCNIPACPFTNPGHKVTGWNTERDGSGTAYALKASVTLTEDLTLYAQWAECAYKVVFDPNGGTGNVADQTIGYDETQTLTANSFRREGYSFDGWNTKSDGSGDAYGNGDEVINLADENGATVTLYAQWKINTYAVTFDPNGGELDEAQKSQEVEHGSKAKRPTGAKRKGYVLAGWYEDGAEEPYDFDAPVTGNLALTARWNKLEPVGYLDENGEPQTRAGDEYEALTADASGGVLSAGWYAVLENVDLTERVGVDGEVRLILCDGATLTAKQGINVASGNALWVYWQEGKTGALEATGPKHAAGIGGSLRESAGDFVLAGGKVTATGGEGGAGVGAGPARIDNDTETAEESAGGAVTVYAGDLTATGGTHAAGIGGGDAMASELTSRGGTFKIYGGKVVAVGGYYGAGIGSGHAGGKSSFRDCHNYGGTFEAYGGVVEARGSSNGAGIGCGSSYYAHGDAGVVTISGNADVTARGGEYGAGIGVGQGCGNGAVVTISGGKVTAVGGTNGAGIGGGQVLGSDDYGYGSGGKVTITDGVVTATAGSGAAGIGGGHKGDGAEVAISGGEITATGGNNGAGIGAGTQGRVAGSLKVSGGKVTARAGYMAAGIGSGYGPFSGETTPITITVSDGEVYAYGSCEGAAIGGGENNPGGNVTITGGTVVADGRYYSGGQEGKGGAGIGSAAFGKSGGTVLIEGNAEVTAIGGQQSAGIGGSYYGSGADVTIRATDAGAPKVAATGGKLAPGIGRGDSAGDPTYTSGSLTVEGACEVTAIGGERAAGIGGSTVGSGATVVISDGAVVTAQAGTPSDSGHVTQAIGCGDHETATDVDPGSLTIYPEAKVLRGDAEDGDGATAALIEERVSDCRSHLWAQISPCEHVDAACAPTNDKLHHTTDCTHCLGTRDSAGEPVEYDHEFVEDAEGAECACGVRASRVSFDKNADDASGAMEASGLINEALPYNIPACTFDRLGFAFDGWNTAADGTGTAYENEATIGAVGRTNTTLYAQWKANRYTVAFNKNSKGASGAMNPQAFAFGTAQKLAKNAFTRKGYHFVGWNTKADGSGDSFTNGQEVKNLLVADGATMTLYAQWAANSYEVAYSPNGGKGSMANQRFVYDAAQKLAKNVFTRKDHVFSGWNTKADGSGTAYADGAKVANLTNKNGGKVTLFAQWRVNVYTVAFDSAGGSAVKSQKVAYGRRAKRPANPTKGAWSFGGWYADAALRTAYDFSKPVTGNLKLHAKWKRTSIAKVKVSAVADQAYTGKAVKPRPVVKLGRKRLRLGTDYTLSYRKNVRVGKATVTVIGRGSYKGRVSRTFRIVAPTGSCTATLLSGKRSTAAFGKTCGTTGQSMTMTSLSISLARPFPVRGGIKYRTHIQDTGWEGSWRRDGAVSGKPRQRKRLEAVQVRLYGNMAKKYDVYYRAYVQNVGWMGWAKNGARAGTQGGSRRMEAVQVVLVPKGAKAPANTGAATKVAFVDLARKR